MVGQGFRVPHLPTKPMDSHLRGNPCGLDRTRTRAFGGILARRRRQPIFDRSVDHAHRHRDDEARDQHLLAHRHRLGAVRVVGRVRGRRRAGRVRRDQPARRRLHGARPRAGRGDRHSARGGGDAVGTGAQGCLRADGGTRVRRGGRRLRRGACSICTARWWPSTCSTGKASCCGAYARSRPASPSRSPATSTATSPPRWWRTAPP